MRTFDELGFMNTTPSLTIQDLTRREFLATAALAGAGVLVGDSASAQSDASPAAPATARKTRYALVGVGGRSNPPVVPQRKG